MKPIAKAEATAVNKSPEATPVKTDGIEKLLAFLAQYGGEIVSTAKLTPEWINQARASGRLYVDENSLGYVWEPDIKGFPTTEQEDEAFEKWYPLPVEMPQKLADMIFKKIKEKKSATPAIDKSNEAIERMFTLDEMVDAFVDGITECSKNNLGRKARTQEQYFKEKFNINL